MGSHILIVEDNTDNWRLLTWILEDEGHSFIVSESAEDAFDALERDEFDLILMDISLPGIDGKEATRMLRKDSRFAEIPIVAVTAHAIKGLDSEILASGMTTLVTKPIDEEQFLETLRSILAA